MSYVIKIIVYHIGISLVVNIFFLSLTGGIRLDRIVDRTVNTQYKNKQTF